MHSLSRHVHAQWGGGSEVRCGWVSGSKVKRPCWFCYCNPDVIKHSLLFFLSFPPLFIPSSSPSFLLSFPSVLSFFPLLSSILSCPDLSFFSPPSFFPAVHFYCDQHQHLLFLVQLYISWFSSVCVLHGVYPCCFQWAVRPQRRSWLSLGGVQGPYPLSEAWHCEYSHTDTKVSLQPWPTKPTHFYHILQMLTDFFVTTLQHFILIK